MNKNEMMNSWYVYMMSNKPNGIIYIGVTNNINERVKEHKIKMYQGSFTARYNCDKLIYLEEYNNEKDASIRETQLKKWKRDWKLKLIEELNPSWTDLTLNWNIDYKKNRNVKG